MTIRCNFPDFGVIDIVYPREDLEYLDGRRPSSTKLIEFEGDEESSYSQILKTDSSRRDFTINCLYLTKELEILDYQNGQQDLDLKIIRTVGNPNDRFQEDYLRILRAIRFSIKLGFTIHEDTLKAMVLNSSGLSKVSMDRIKNELNKCLLYNPLLTWNYINELNLMYVLKDKGLNFQLTNKLLKT